MLKTIISELRKIYDDQGELTYILNRKNVKNINLRITTDGKVTVSANLHVPASRIDEYVVSKAEFIRKSLKKFSIINENRNKINRNYINRNSLLLLGKERKIELIKSQSSSVSITDDKILVSVNNEFDEDLKQQIIENFIKNLAKDTFERIAKQVYPSFKDKGVAYPTIKIRKMKSKWGSCRPYCETITLNLYLIQAPIWCIEYVIVHEFCHFVQPNHSKAFYSLLTEVMSDGIERNEKMKELERSGILMTR